MADVKNDSNKTTQPVDIETMKVKLLIVCKEQGRLDSVASFLNRRGWEAQVTTKIKDALAIVSTLKPDFVLVSANHPNPKLLRFPIILKATFNISTIGFAETNDGKTQHTLQNLPVEHRIAGELTGPSTQRRIKQILRDLHTSNDNKAERKTNNQKSGSSDDLATKESAANSEKSPSYVAIKGEREKTARSGPAYMPDHKEQAKRALELAAEFGDDENLGDNKTSSSEPTATNEPNLLTDTPDTGTDDLVSYGKAATKSQNAAADDLSDGDIPNAGGIKIFEEDFSLDPAEIADIVAGVKKDIQPASTPYNEIQRATEIAESVVEATAAESVRRSATELQRPAATVKTQTPKIAETKGPVRRAFTKNPEKISFFEKLVIKILNDVAAKRQATEHKINSVERLVIISVQSPNTNGYLVISSSATTKGLREISLEVRDHLSKFLRQEGKMFEFGAPAMVMCSTHQFFNDTEQQLEFSHVAAVGNGEIALKFLAAPQPIPKLQKVESGDKLRVEADEIPLDRPTDFKFHIHLEKNMKYVVLIREGGAFTAKYKERLKEYGKGLFIDEVDAEKFKRFFTTALALEILKVESFRVEYAETQKSRAA
jgi:hypothetical protein